MSTNIKVQKLKTLEFFGGIGAIRKAYERAGIPYEIVDYVEIDKHAVDSYNAIFGTNFEPQDICEWNKDIDVDLIAFSAPCVDISTNGKGAGANEGSGTRSSLMWEAVRNISRLKPKFIISENVKNLVCKKHIHNLKKYEEDMDKLGYNTYYKVLNSKDYQIPQSRERVFIVSIRKEIDKGFKFPERKELNKTYKDFLQQEYDVEEVVLKPEELKQVHGLECCNVKHNFGGKIVTGDLYNTISASYGKVSGNSGKILCKEGYRILTSLECFRLMGFDDEDYEKASKVNSNKQLYKQARKFNSSRCFSRNIKRTFQYKRY